MADPTPRTRRLVYERDNHRCANCGLTVGLSFQHRRAVGMGGTKTRPLITDGLTLCLVCNQAAEASGQNRALRNGHKIPKSWPTIIPALVPVYYFPELTWYRLNHDGTRTALNALQALEIMIGLYGERTYFGWSKV